MRTIVRRLGRNLRDPGSVVSVIVGVFVGALLGGHYEARAPTHTVPARGREGHPGDRDACLLLEREPLLSLSPGCVKGGF